MRRSGKTTRLINDCVQDLFNTKALYIPHRYISEMDIAGLPQNVSFHYDPDYTSTNRAQKDFLYRLLKRLQSEHKGQFSVDTKKHLTVISLI